LNIIKHFIPGQRTLMKIKQLTCDQLPYNAINKAILRCTKDMLARQLRVDILNVLLQDKLLNDVELLTA